MKPGEALEGFHEEAARRFGDYAFHALDCRSEQQAKQFLTSLSFVSGDWPNLGFSGNLVLVGAQPGGAILVAIAGKFTVQENYDIGKKCNAMGVKSEKGAMCDSPGNPVVLNLMEAGQRLKAERPWWKFWG